MRGANPHYDVIVYAQRNAQPAYRYDAYQGVRQSRLEHVLARLAGEIIDHEGRSGAFITSRIRDYQGGTALELRPRAGGPGVLRFILRIQRSR